MWQSRTHPRYWATTFRGETSDAGGAGGVRGLRCRFFVCLSGHAARVSTSNRNGASTPGNVGPGRVSGS